jgi:transcription termination/antitermination protein NusA
MAVSANRLELLQIADAVAREKAIDRGIVIAAMEDAIAKAARSRYGSETDVHADIDPKTGELRLSRHLLVVETVENPANQISLEGARRHNPAAQLGDTIADALPPLEYGRIAAQSAKQVIVQKVREAERDRQYQEYKDRISDIVNGLVKRVEYGNVVVDLGRGEAIVRRDEMLPREVFRNGDRIRAYIYDVRREARGPQIFLSRTHPQFMAKLFAQEVPEIYDGIVEVKAVARDPGSRAKIAVISRDSSVDPVGACVGMRGSRVQAVVNELQGEKIDIIPWSPDIATFVVNALAPAEVAKVVLDEDRERIEVVVPDQQLSLAIGRRGQNVRLASQLTGWDIDILTEQEESERRQAEFENRTRIFMDALNVDEVVGQLLASEGFASIEELAVVDEKELASIEGFDLDTAQELQNRAREYLARIEEELDARRQEFGVEDALKEVPGVTTRMLVTLGENDIKTVEDLAGCATDELSGWSERKDGETVRHPGILDGFELSREETEAIIMQARVKAGWVSEEDLAPETAVFSADDMQALGHFEERLNLCAETQNYRGAIIVARTQIAWLNQRADSRALSGYRALALLRMSTWAAALGAGEEGRSYLVAALRDAYNSLDREIVREVLLTLMELPLIATNPTARRRIAATAKSLSTTSMANSSSEAEPVTHHIFDEYA